LVKRVVRDDANARRIAVGDVAQALGDESHAHERLAALSRVQGLLARGLSVDNRQQYHQLPQTVSPQQLDVIHRPPWGFG
jgi:hypothetical protein